MATRAALRTRPGVPDSPSFTGTHARTGSNPAPSTGAPIAAGDNEYRACSGAVYRALRRLPTPRIVRTRADTAGCDPRTCTGVPNCGMLI